MDRRKFLKSAALVPVVLTAGCVVTFNGKDTKFEPNPVPTEKKHFERPLVSRQADSTCRIDYPWYTPAGLRRLS